MAVAHDAASTATGANVTSLSWSHAGGTPTAVGTGISWWDGESNAITGVTYDGVAQTVAAAATRAGFADRCSIYGLGAPAAGTKTVAVTWGAGVYPVAGAETVTGSDTSTVFSNTATADGSSTTPSVTVTSATGELVLAVMDARQTFTTDASQTERWNTNQSGLRGAGMTEAGAASVVMNGTLGASDNWIFAGVSFKEAAAGAAVGSGLVTGLKLERMRLVG
jgi:hypothetical protein